MKKFIGLCLLLAVALSFCVFPACAENTTADILSKDEMTQINSAFPQEIQYIETQKSIDLESLSEVELEMLKDAVIPQLGNPDYNFTGLMSALTGALAKKETENSSKARWVYEDVIQDYCVRQYGPIKGEYITEVAAAATHTGGFSVSVELGYEIDDFTIGAAFSLDGSVSLSGPAVNDKLANGKTTTHHIAIGVMFGEIWYKEYDIVTAFNRTRVSMYYVKDNTADTYAFTLPAHLSVPTYAQSAVSDECAQFADQRELEAAIVSTPARFVIEGAMNP